MALKPTTCKEAIARWEKLKGEVAADATVIELQFQWPPIEKMDGALSTLVACEKLSLSSNMIDKIVGIAGMRNLKILSLGRNYIKSLAGIITWNLLNKKLTIQYHTYELVPTRIFLYVMISDIPYPGILPRTGNVVGNIAGTMPKVGIKEKYWETVADTLEELWISYNPIDKLKGIGSLKKLRVLYMSNNLIKEWVEFNRLQECPALRDLVFTGNPLCDNQPDVDAWRTQASNRLQQITKLDGIPIVREA